MVGRRRHCLAALALVAALLSPSAGISGDSAVERLQRGEALTCEPVYEVFCGNIHVACAGRSTLPTTAMSIALEGDRARLTASGDPGGEQAGPARLGADSAYLLVSFPPNKGYFRLEADGRFSHRVYRQGRALISRGACR